MCTWTCALRIRHWNCVAGERWLSSKFLTSIVDGRKKECLFNIIIPRNSAREYYEISAHSIVSCLSKCAKSIVEVLIRGAQWDQDMSSLLYRICMQCCPLLWTIIACVNSIYLLIEKWIYAWFTRHICSNDPKSLSYAKSIRYLI